MKHIAIVQVDELGFPKECREFESLEHAKDECPISLILSEPEWKGYKLAMDQYHGDKKPRPKRKWWKFWSKQK